MAPEGPVASLPSGLANIGSPQATAKEGRDVSNNLKCLVCRVFNELANALQHAVSDIL